MSSGTSIGADAPARTASPFLVLGSAGLIPFVAGAAALWMLPHAYEPYVLQWLLGYAMVILAFVGALHWGVAMQAKPSAHASPIWIAAGWGVIPALVGWLALAFESAVALRILAGMFLLQLAMDRWLTRNFSTPAWYLPLRIVLTLVAVSSLLVASFAGFGNAA
jgi:hypothetical protein